MGTPDFAIPVLKSLQGVTEEVVGVYTAPDRPRGRNRHVAVPPVKEYAMGQGLTVVQPSTLRREAAVEEFRRLAPDLVVVAAYGRIIPPDMLEVPLHGFINVHPSLLPKYRGASPVITALLDGVTETGVTLIRLGEGLDDGPILAQMTALVRPQETCGELTLRLFDLGAQLLTETIPLWTGGRLKAVPQDEAAATFTRKIAKEDGEARWDLSARVLERQARAYTPWPGLYSRWNGRVVKLLEVEAVDMPLQGAPGTVISLNDRQLRLAVATGDGVLAVHTLQAEGRIAMSADDFLRGQDSLLGAVLPS